MDRGRLWWTPADDPNGYIIGYTTALRGDAIEGGCPLHRCRMDSRMSKPDQQLKRPLQDDASPTRLSPQLPFPDEPRQSACLRNCRLDHHPKARRRSRSRPVA